MNKGSYSSQERPIESGGKKIDSQYSGENNQFGKSSTEPIAERYATESALLSWASARLLLPNSGLITHESEPSMNVTENT